MYKKEKTEKLKSNIKYLIKSRGETRLSLCNSSGLTRTTIYNILEGKVVNVQQSTIRKISDFFGVSYKEIETVDFEEKEIIESSVSLQGNMNPAAVPIIKESLLFQSLDKRIGELAATHPLNLLFWNRLQSDWCALGEGNQWRERARRSTDSKKRNVEW